MEFTEKTIVLKNFEEFIRFTALLDIDLNLSSEVPSFLKLARDIKNENNAVLCKAEKIIDSHVFKLLGKVQERNPKFEFGVEIWKDDTIKNHFIDILKKMVFIQLNSEYLIDKIGKPIFYQYETEFIEIVDSIFKNENLLYSFYTTEFFTIHAQNGKQGFHPELIAAFRRGLFACGMELTSSNPGSSDFLRQLFQICLALGCATRGIVQGKLKSDNDFLKAFEKATSMSNTLTKLGFESATIEPIKKLLSFKYKKDDTLSFESDENEASVFAQIIAVADQFEYMLSRNADTEVDGARALDILYVLSKKGRFKKEVIDNLAHWMEKQEVFRFYKTLERLEHACTMGSNGSSLAVPYPMRGMGSPTLFVCSKNNLECKHLSSAFKKINITESAYKLKSGSYTKCIWLTDELKQYYNKYYIEIKEEAKTHDQFQK